MTAWQAFSEGVKDFMVVRGKLCYFSGDKKRYGVSWAWIGVSRRI
ncbi:hypothetical protein P5G65_19185 [Paenibacillus chondroitinus]|uniref:Uncharacterized protein n=1 Tax=Paenibacillus chondroitinus TaxID=59842 RepID=A0ABU6DE48_9BACL|nr:MULTISPECIES: hypothetical protein [Paenibacillus]MEB4796030.1 hypothetical protein [Paenibacillus chondroitinus]